MKKAIHIIIVILLIWITTFFIWFITKDSIGISMNEFFIYQNNSFHSSDKIVIIRVDNKSLDALQKTDLRVFNLSKTVFSTLIQKLNAMSTRAIGLDIVFTNASEDESIFTQVLQNNKNVVIWARIGIEKDSEQILPRLAFSGTTWGMVNIQRHGKLASRITPYQFLSWSIIEAMSIAVYRKYMSDTFQFSNNNSSSYVLNPLRKIPLNNGLILIPFFHLPEWYPSYSLIDVLEDHIPTSAFSGKIVLVGEYGTLIHDAYLSPIDPNKPMPWVEFHANMIDSLLTGKFLEEKNTLPFAALLILISAYIFYIFPIIWHPVYTAIIFPILIIICRYIFADSGWIYDFFLLTLSLSISFIVTILYRYLITNRERRFIEHAFMHYISPEVVKKISKNPSSLKLGGEKREITVIFSDIAGFTTLSEQLWTEKLFELISEYLSEMTDILTAHHGTLDKYIGDAIMWFFWAPIRMNDGHIRACATALEMQDRINELMEKWIIDGIPEFSARIWIHTGEAMIGNIGSKNHFNYTVMWDTVNLASRLEGVNKEYGTLICVSHTVYEYSYKVYDFRELDTIRVKWKHEWVKIYELLGLQGSRSEVHNIYEEWLSFYYEWHYNKAIKILEEISNIDIPTRTIIARCRELIKNDINLENWIWTMQRK